MMHGECSRIRLRFSFFLKNRNGPANRIDGRRWRSPRRGPRDDVGTKKAESGQEEGRRAGNERNQRRRRNIVSRTLPCVLDALISDTENMGWAKFMATSGESEFCLREREREREREGGREGEREGESGITMGARTSGLAGLRGREERERRGEGGQRKTSLFPEHFTPFPPAGALLSASQRTNSSSPSSSTIFIPLSSGPLSFPLPLLSHHFLALPRTTYSPLSRGAS